MRNMFGYGTDKMKIELRDSNQEKAKLFLGNLIKHFPLIAEPLGINSQTINMDAVTEKVAKMNLKDLLDLAINACEPYLVPENSVIKFSYPRELQQYYEKIKSLNLAYTQIVDALSIQWDEEENCLFLFPSNYSPDNEFKQSVRIWLLMSSLYSGSIQMNSTFESIIRPLNLGDDSCKKIRDFFHSKYYNINGNLINKNAEYFYNGSTCFIDSFYDIMVANGLLGSEFNTDGTIKSRHPWNDGTKHSNRLPDNVTPSFLWDSKKLNCNINFDLHGLDFQLLTEYLIERKTGANFTQYNAKVDVFSGDLENLFSKIQKELPEKLVNALVLYPLPHFRLTLLESMIHINSSNYSENKSSNSEHKEKDWRKLTDDLNYQNVVYFPLIDMLFHLLLKFKYNNYGERTELTEQLRKLYETPIYQQNFQHVVKVTFGEFVSINLRIALTDGSYFTVTKNSKVPDIDEIALDSHLANPITVINNDFHSFVSCLKTAFGKDYDTVKSIPEETFAEYIKAVFKKCDGFIEDASSKNVYKTCINEVFKDYKETLKGISPDCFKELITLVCLHYQKYEYEYLFNYNEETGFTPVFGLQKDKLYGITVEELENELQNISARFQTDINAFYKKDRPYKYYKNMTANANRVLDSTESLLNRNFQWLCKMNAFLNDLTLNPKYHLPTKLVAEYTVREELSKSKYKYESEINKAIEYINHISKELDKVKTIKNNDFPLVRDYIESTVELDTEEASDIYQSVYYFYMYYRKYVYDKEEYKPKKSKKGNFNSYLKLLAGSSYIDVEEFLSWDYNQYRYNYCDTTFSIKGIVNILKEHNQRYCKTIKEYMNFDPSVLGKGSTHFYREMNNLLNMYDGNKKDIVKEAMIFNSHDMTQVIKAIDNFNRLNSNILKHLHDYDCILNSLSDTPKEYRCYNNYEKLLSQF